MLLAAELTPASVGQAKPFAEDAVRVLAWLHQQQASDLFQSADFPAEDSSETEDDSEQVAVVVVAAVQVSAGEVFD